MIDLKDFAQRRAKLLDLAVRLAPPTRSTEDLHNHVVRVCGDEGDLNPTGDLTEALEYASLILGPDAEILVGHRTEGDGLFLPPWASISTGEHASGKRRSSTAPLAVMRCVVQILIFRLQDELLQQLAEEEIQ